MVTPHQSVDLCVLTRFSILSDVLSHSWGLFGKRTRLLRNLLPPPPKPSLDKRRDDLFSPERLAYRFWSFETLLLPSLACQDDRRFRHGVFTSEDLPDWASDRLDGLSDRHGFQILRLDTTTDLDTALQAWGPESPGTTTPTATLRIDDDDALARSAVAEIHAQT